MEGMYLIAILGHLNCFEDLLLYVMLNEYLCT